jgi:hypothetical protein
MQNKGKILAEKNIKSKKGGKIEKELTADFYSGII